MKEIIVKKAKELDIDDIGFTSFEVTPWYRANVSKFYAKNLNCSLSLEKENLINNNEKNFKTVISIIVAYPFDKNFNNTSKHKASFSASSQGLDYHDILKAKLIKLADFLKEKYNINSHIQVDNGKFDDRYWAYKSGLGVIGKNGMFIHKNFGSFVFLGELFIDEEIKSNAFTHQTCIGCNECIRKCPTNSIQNGNMNTKTKTCLSYLSQAKTKIDKNYARKINLIYGCDICNQVCPHNKGILTNSNMRKEDKEVDLLEFIKLSNKEFKEKYGYLSGAWRGRLVLIRNAIWILANRKYSGILEIIEEMLISDYPKWFLENLLECKEYLNKI